MCIPDKPSQAAVQHRPPDNEEKENPGSQHPDLTPDPAPDPDVQHQQQQKPDPRDVISLDSLDILDQVRASYIGKIFKISEHLHAS